MNELNWIFDDATGDIDTFFLEKIMNKMFSTIKTSIKCPCVYHLGILSKTDE